MLVARVQRGENKSPASQVLTSQCDCDGEDGGEEEDDELGDALSDSFGGVTPRLAEQWADLDPTKKKAFNDRAKELTELLNASRRDTTLPKPPGSPLQGSKDDGAIDGGGQPHNWLP